MSVKSCTRTQGTSRFVGNIVSSVLLGETYGKCKGLVGFVIAREGGTGFTTEFPYRTSSSSL